MTSKVVVSIFYSRMVRGLSATRSMRRTRTSVCAVENTLTSVNSATTDCSPPRVRKTSSISALPCQQRCNVCGNSVEERSTNVDDTLKSVKLWLTSAGRRARRRRSVLGTGRPCGVPARHPAHIRPDPARQLASTVGRSGHFYCPIALRYSTYAFDKCSAPAGSLRASQVIT